MPFVKLVKDKAYHKRFQVKFRRRREGKTDYYQRKRLVAQAKNKYLMPKYRLVVRFSNKYVTCQIITATIAGDRVLCAAYSNELPRYGLKAGLKNYAAAYCTGLLLARRLMAKLDIDRTMKLSEMYIGSEEVDGEVNKCEDDDGRVVYVNEMADDMRPFRANLDVGLRPTTLGCRVFGALKGASDGGLDVPHNYKRFPGYDPDTKEYVAEEHKEKILGHGVSEYMAVMEEDNIEKYQKHFSKFIEAGINSDNYEDVLVATHAAIRKDPSPAPKSTENKSNPKYRRAKRRSNAQRKDRVRQKLAAHAAKQE